MGASVALLYLCILDFDEKHLLTVTPYWPVCKRVVVELSNLNRQFLCFKIMTNDFT